jgi:GAF domain-containing protein/ANTAR domain-containing protein
MLLRDVVATPDPVVLHDLETTGGDVNATDGGMSAARRRVERLCLTSVRGAGVDGCGVSVLTKSGTPLALHATNRVAAVIEELQFTLGEGPCMDAAASGVPVLVSDLRDPSEGVAGRWPAFLDEADRAGVRAVFAFPVRIGAIALGVIDLYRSKPGGLSQEQLSTTFSTVDAMSRSMLDWERVPPEEEDESYPLTVHQAAGIVMVQLDTTIEEALVRLRAAAYRTGRPMGDLAADVVSGRYTFGEKQT